MREGRPRGRPLMGIAAGLAVLGASAGLAFAAGSDPQEDQPGNEVSAAETPSPPRGDEPAKARSVRLFTIGRSTNANVVVYEARLGPGGFDPKKPIRASWIMVERGGAREGLNLLEEPVYGVVLRSSSPTEVKFAVAAVPSRVLTVRPAREGAEVLIDLEGTPCRLEGIFITTAAGLIPAVKYAEITGTSLADGKRIVERIEP